MEQFQACGWPSWFSLLVALVAVAVATIALSNALLRAPRAVLLSWAALAVALLPVGVGAAGLVIGRSRVEGIISGGFVDPSQLVAIREQGYREAGSCVTVGVAMSAAAAAACCCRARAGVRDRQSLANLGTLRAGKRGAQKVVGLAD